jgi:hypothetical protein
VDPQPGIDVSDCLETDANLVVRIKMTRLLKHVMWAVRGRPVVVSSCELAMNSLNRSFDQMGRSWLMLSKYGSIIGSRIPKGGIVVVVADKSLADW